MMNRRRKIKFWLISYALHARAHLDGEERIVENDLVHVREARVILDLGVDEEEDGHLDLLVRLQPLLLKAKALDLVEVETALERVDIVGGHTSDGRVGLVLGEVKGERRVARVDLQKERDRKRETRGHVQNTDVQNVLAYRAWYKRVLIE